MKATRRYAVGLAAIAVATAGLLAGTAGGASAAGSPAFVGPLHHTSVIASTVPGNGDVNPYGVAVVPRSTGDLFRGNVLVSNFNDKANVQGTGTTIVEVTPSGHQWVFAKINRNLPQLPRRRRPDHRPDRAAQRLGHRRLAAHPRAAISGAGCLIVLDQWGHVRETFTGDGINGPWDMASLDLGSQAVLFVTNVLNGTVAGNGKTVFGGTVLRLVIKIPPVRAAVHLVRHHDRIRLPASAPNSAALVVGPTGAGLGRNGVLYVADTLEQPDRRHPQRAVPRASAPGPASPSPGATT